MRLLVPATVGEVDPAEVYADVPVTDGRPSVRLNMIASVDGAIAVDGVSGGLGAAADHAVFVALRSLADVVIVAAGTARAEAYGPAVLPESARAARSGRGQTPVPAIAVVSRACRMDWDSPFFAAATERPVLITVEAAPAERRVRAAEVADVIVAGRDDVDLARALDALAARGARSVLAEGGPTFNGQLARSGLLDELCLTLSPVLAGGDGRGILTGEPLARPAGLRLRSVGQDGDFLFLRFSVR